jgi:phage tail sheath protein FI
MAYAEIDSVTNTSLAAAIAWKSANNYVDPQLHVLFPRASIGGQIFAPEIPRVVAIAQTDASRGGIPYVSSSNKPTFIDSTVLASGLEFDITFDNDDYLNANGISTFANYGAGWMTWGNRNSVYGPLGDTDPVDMWENVRRMFIWMGNTLVLTLMQFVDQPGGVAGVDDVLQTMKSWLNALVAVGALLPGATCTFTPNDNQLINVLNGVFTFAANVAVPIPMETIQINMSYDTSQLQTFINSVGLAA